MTPLVILGGRERALVAVVGNRHAARSCHRGVGTQVHDGAFGLRARGSATAPSTRSGGAIVRYVKLGGRPGYPSDGQLAFAVSRIGKLYGPSTHKAPRPQQIGDGAQARWLDYRPCHQIRPMNPTAIAAATSRISQSVDQVMMSTSPTRSRRRGRLWRTPGTVSYAGPARRGLCGSLAAACWD